MSATWINDLTTKGQRFEEPPKCSRDTLLKDLGDHPVEIDEEVSIMPWEMVGEEIGITRDFDKLFFHLIPEFKGTLCSPKIEKMALLQTYEGVSILMPSESNRLVFEAAIYIVTLSTIVEEGINKDLSTLENFDEIEVYGHSLKKLIDIVGTVLVPQLTMRLKNLLISNFKVNERHSKPDAKVQLETCRLVKSSYDRYLRYRNLDGYFEGGLLCALAVCNESGADLTVGAVGDIVECCILNHDTHGVARHFCEEDIANVHRFLGGDLSISLHRAFKRSITVLRRVREDPNISPSLKRVLCTFGIGSHTLNYSISRYGLGKPFTVATELLVSQKKPEEYVEGSHHVKIDRGATFAQLNAKA